MENLNRYEMAINSLEKIKSIMENTIKKYGVNPADLCEDGGIFVVGDGSCPPYISFDFNKEYWG